MESRSIPRSGHTLVSKENKIIGQVSSGTQSPTLSKGIGLGYLDTDFAKPGTKISVLIREKKCPAQVIKLPFIKS